MTPQPGTSQTPQEIGAAAIRWANDPSPLVDAATDESATDDAATDDAADVDESTGDAAGDGSFRDIAWICLPARRAGRRGPHSAPAWVQRHPDFKALIAELDLWDQRNPPLRPRARTLNESAAPRRSPRGG